MHYVLSPVGQGPPYPAVLATSLDVTGVERDRERARRGQLLAGITPGMTTANDPDDALQALVDALVPEIAAIAAVYVVPARPGDPRDSSPAAIKLAPGLLEELGPPPSGRSGGPDPWDGAIGAGQEHPHRRPRAGRPRRGGRRLARLARRAGSTTDRRRAARRGRGARGSARPRGRAGPEPVPGRRPAVPRGRRRARGRRRVARAQRASPVGGALDLQRALLPSALPHLQEVDYATRYVAGSPEVDVGGDWFDLTDLGAGRIGLGVGDVSGRGLPAAAVMGQARAAMRAAAHAALGPGDLLALLDTHVSELVAPQLQRDVRIPPRFATALYGVLEPFDETLRIASAGHPPVLVRDPDGRVRRVEAVPTPLGLGIGPFPEIVTRFPPGSVLAAYTDGLVESREVDVELGMTRLARVSRRAGGSASLEELADTLLTAAGADRAADDVALLLVRLSPAAAQVQRTQLLLSSLSDVAAARRAVAAVAAATRPDRAGAIIQVTSGSRLNALEHAGAPVDCGLREPGGGSSCRRRTRSALPSVRRCRPRRRARPGAGAGRRPSPTPGACGSAWGKTTWPSSSPELRRPFSVTRAAATDRARRRARRVARRPRSTSSSTKSRSTARSSERLGVRCRRPAHRRFSSM